MLAYVENVGPYDNMPWDELVPRLYGWAKEHKVMPGFHPIGFYYDDPEMVPKERCRSDVAITFKGEAAGSGGVMTKSLPAMKVATVSFKGTSAEYADTYRALFRWIEESEHRPAGPSMEVYSKMPEVVDGVTILYAKIMVPVERA